MNIVSIVASRRPMVRPVRPPSWSWWFGALAQHGNGGLTVSAESPTTVAGFQRGREDCATAQVEEGATSTACQPTLKYCRGKLQACLTLT